MFTIYKKINLLIKILFVVVTTVFLLINSIFIAGFFKPIYSFVYDKTDIFEKTGYSKEMYISEVEKFKSYLLYNDDDALLEPARYNNDEIKHMHDVKELFKFGKMAVFISFISIVLIMSCVAKKKAIHELKKSMHFVVILPIILLIIILIDFGSFWVKFHQIAFSNDLWLMDPDVSLMINHNLQL